MRPVIKIKKAPGIIIILLLVNSFVLQAQPASSGEYQLKAVFLYNFTQFVDWPPGSFSSAQSPIVIGILGKDPFNSYLQETVAGEKVNGRSLVINHYKTVEEISECHVLFISVSEARKQDKIIAGLRGQKILTVSDSPDFTKQGGIIKFFTKSNKIKLQINLEASKAANLVISSKLLKLAEIYTP